MLVVQNMHRKTVTIQFFILCNSNAINNLKVDYVPQNLSRSVIKCYKTMNESYICRLCTNYHSGFISCKRYPLETSKLLIGSLTSEYRISEQFYV